MAKLKFPKISALRTAESFREHLNASSIELGFDEELQSGVDGPLGRPKTLETIRGSKAGSTTIGNRFCILPMEGWDACRDGKPTELTFRRWKNFGSSGAKLIWGGEAVAVRQDGRANPNQLLIIDDNLASLDSLRNSLVEAHESKFGKTNDLFVGLQLTHSGRFAKPNDHHLLEPRTVYAHPILDKKFLCNDSNILSDSELNFLVDDFVSAAVMAEKIGFQFVDVKHCHGYLGHELLSGYDRPGLFGGSFENRTRFLRTIVAGIRSEAPHLQIGVRLSIFDFSPFAANPEGVGVPSSTDEYGYAWGGTRNGQGVNLGEPLQFLELLRDLGIRLVCTTAGSPYYNPHIQRPATYPPSDGYLPPEDPLAGVARQINTTAELKSSFPEMLIVGSGYSYLQEWLPHVGQHQVRHDRVDMIGLGRMVLSYPDLPADVIQGKTLARKKVCRTFSDCTTAPRKGLVSGCYPLDPFYKSRPERQSLKESKDK